MRIPGPEISSDPFMELEGRRAICKVDGQQIRGSLISVRDGFLTFARRPYQTQDNLEQVRNFQHNRGAAAHFPLTENHKDVLEVNVYA